MDQEIKDELIQILQDFGTRYEECYGEEEDVQCLCDACNGNRVRESLKNLIQPKYLPTRRYIKRLEYNEGDNLENRYVKCWQEINNNKPWSKNQLDYILHEGKEVSTIREIEIATSVIQWLGTNCGQSFFRDLAKISK